MKKFPFLVLIILVFSLAAFAQGSTGQTKPPDRDKTRPIPTSGVLKRGNCGTDPAIFVKGIGGGSVCHNARKLSLVDHFIRIPG